MTCYLHSTRSLAVSDAAVVKCHVVLHNYRECFLRLQIQQFWHYLAFCQFDKSANTFLQCNICDHQVTEYEIALRQLAVKDYSDLSSFLSERNILDLYSLPLAYELIENPPIK